MTVRSRFLGLAAMLMLLVTVCSAIEIPSETSFIAPSSLPNATSNAEHESLMNELAQYQTKIKAKMRDVYGKDLSRLNTTHMDLSRKYEVRVLEKALKEHKKFHDQARSAA